MKTAKEKNYDKETIKKNVPDKYLMSVIGMLYTDNERKCCVKGENCNKKGNRNQ